VDLFLTPFVSPGNSQTFEVHSGFLAAYNDVADIVLSTVKAQAAKFPSYDIVITGEIIPQPLFRLLETNTFVYRSQSGRISRRSRRSFGQDRPPKCCAEALHLRLFVFLQLFPAFTYPNFNLGQPRTGDAKWAAFVESTIGTASIFRGGCIHPTSP
jgi:hypothetical protein